MPRIVSNRRRKKSKYKKDIEEALSKRTFDLIRERDIKKSKGRYYAKHKKFPPFSKQSKTFNSWSAKWRGKPKSNYYLRVKKIHQLHPDWTLSELGGHKVEGLESTVQWKRMHYTGKRVVRGETAYYDYFLEYLPIFVSLKQTSPPAKYENGELVNYKFMPELEGYIPIDSGGNIKTLYYMLSSFPITPDQWAEDRFDMVEKTIERIQKDSPVSVFIPVRVFRNRSAMKRVGDGFQPIIIGGGNIG